MGGKGGDTDRDAGEVRGQRVVNDALADAPRARGAQSVYASAAYDPRVAQVRWDPIWS